MNLPYCLNIHPGEDLASVRDAIARYACAVKAVVSPNDPYPLGLRLAARAAEELTGDAALDAFRGLLRQHDLFVTGINGFPYGTFHSTAVKTAVYQPDWSTPERLTYTGRLATFLAAVLPEGQVGNISTVPLGYKGNGSRGRSPSTGESDAGEFWRASDPASRVYARQVAVMAEFLHDLKLRTGREVVLAIEPEPDCLLEETDEVIAWFEDELFYEGRKWLSANNRRTPDEAEALLRTYVGLCLDTCHFAVEFEEPLTAMVRFESAGLRIARIQLSAALRATIDADALSRLAAFVDPVYLHQTKIRLPRGRILALSDLTPETLKAAAAHDGCELRTHFHVPLFYDGDGVLNSTHGDLSPEFFAHAIEQRYPLEIETYTFNVLPDAIRPSSVIDSLVRETLWVRSSAPALR